MPGNNFTQKVSLLALLRGRGDLKTGAGLTGRRAPPPYA
jgi:hypothetical protein